MGSNGTWREDQVEIEWMVLEYFASIFKSDKLRCFEASLNVVNNRVTQEMNEELLVKFRPEEVWRALKQMHPTNSPSPNGMSPIFFQKYWDIVGPNVISTVLEALNSCSLPSG